MKKRRFTTGLLAGLLYLVLTAGLAGCGQEPAAPSSVPQAQSSASEAVATPEAEPVTLRLAGGDTGLPNPFKHAARGPGMSKMQILYDSLLEKDENGEIPWLAKSWEISSDGTVYTFHMQENAVWHDGKPLTAEDAVFTLAYYKDHPPVSNDLLVGSEYIVTDAKALDTYTLEVTFNRFDHTYLTKLGNMRIIPKHIWENVDDPIAYDGKDATIGSGPYKLDTYDAQQGAYRYVAFEQYWGLTPAAEAIEWVPASDSVLAFENGEIDLINAPADILPNYQNNPKYTVKTAHSFHSYRLMMNMESVEELRDVSLRQALVYGINRQELVDKAARGSAMISSQGYVLPVSGWYNQNTPKYDYNADTARALLDGKTYSFKLLTDNSADGMKVAELIKLSLADIGVKVTVESVESKTRDNAVNTGEYELLLINSGGMGGDPDYLRIVYGEGAKTIKGWSSPEIAALIKEQAAQQDEGKRKELIFEIQEKIAAEVPMILLHGAMDNFVFRPETYDGWMFRYDHSKCDHNKLSYLVRK
ncbi:ABC transporter substrate-binding protein [Oscillospiraceae bacterium MB08-C2-2]|nr:ABC transporter substrate-binding protein [Oscillospiraceae bacterium MB08-C2-2]